MISFKKQQDTWNRFLRERKYRLSLFGLTPHFDWKLILLLSLLTLIAISVAGIGTYRRVVSLSESDIDLEPVTHTFVNPNEVNKFISEFEKKDKRFNTLLGASTVAE